VQLYSILECFKAGKEISKAVNVAEVDFFYATARKNELELHTHCIIMNVHFKNEILKGQK